MERKTIGMIYFAVLVLLAVSVLVLSYFDDKARDKIIEDLKVEYNVNEEAGDQLVQCEDGSYDVYKPYNETQTMICGMIIS